MFIIISVLLTGMWGEAKGDSLPGWLLCTEAGGDGNGRKVR